ncbi:hypothetical protein TSUD_254550 [Trifolium subterraneum]|uniref:Uncharacterized protein n=1 Tax=Trifolium subterraneum TaxID=3900 RepID=A0A2Z6PK96_TRISU|nr:hypothetical protein TSUD_254550 [Trifolium subterraneum]
MQAELQKWIAEEKRCKQNFFCINYKSSPSSTHRLTFHRRHRQGHVIILSISISQTATETPPRIDHIVSLLKTSAGRIVFSTTGN